MKYLISLILLISLSISGEIRVVAASDLIYALNQVKSKYQSRYQNDKISISFGSSGKAFTQIIHNAPYDIYLSANMSYVERLHKRGLTATKPKAYAYGRIGIWVANSKDINISKGMDILLDKKIKKISIANPRHAPYGVAAVEALKSQGYYSKVRQKLVMGENVSQTAQFALSGASDAGIVPISLAISKEMKSRGKFYLFPSNWHKPIKQGYALLKRASNNHSAKRFEEYLSSKEAREIFKEYGFRIE